MEVIHTIVGAAVALLVLGALGPAISTGLNNTAQAFPAATFPGVATIVNILPILLIVGVGFAAVSFGRSRGYL